MKRNLNRNIEDLSDFKIVMQAIKAIQSTNIATELQLHGIQETFAILNDHSIEVSAEVVFLPFPFLASSDAFTREPTSWARERGRRE